MRLSRNTCWLEFLSCQFREFLALCCRHQLSLLVFDFEDESIGVVRAVALDATQDEFQRFALVVLGRNEIGCSGVPKRVHHVAHIILMGRETPL